MIDLGRALDSLYLLVEQYRKAASKGDVQAREALALPVNILLRTTGSLSDPDNGETVSLGEVLVEALMLDEKNAA